MKKALCMLVAAMVLLSGTVVYAASPEDLMNGMGQKLFRGVVNTFTGWVEIPAQMVKGYDRGFAGDENNKATGAFAGIFDGLWMAMGRTMSGAEEFATFWAADPESNDGISVPLDAEYAWEKGTHYNVCDPNFQEATLSPMGYKLTRGLGYALFGVAEVPGQIVKGIKEKAPDIGIVKGIWYWLSREIEGCYDISTFFLPNPADTKALKYDEKWPWSALGNSMK